MPRSIGGPPSATSSTSAVTFGRDVFNFKSSSADFGSRIPWGNCHGDRALEPPHQRQGLHHHHRHLQRLLTLHFEAQQDSFIFWFRSGIDDRGIKSRLTLYPNPRHTVRAGLEYTFTPFLPTEFLCHFQWCRFRFGRGRTHPQPRIRCLLEDEFDISDALRIKPACATAALFKRALYPLCPAVGCDPLVPARPRRDRITQGELVATTAAGAPPLHALDHRARSSFKAGMAGTSSTSTWPPFRPRRFPVTSGCPAPTWSTPRWHAGIAGWFRDFGTDRNVEASVEVYHKWLSNLVAYRRRQPTQTTTSATTSTTTWSSGRHELWRGALCEAPTR